MTADTEYKISTFDVENASIRDVIAILRADDVRVCLECDSNVAYKPLTMHCARASVSQILNQITTVEPHLKWDYDEKLKVFNVYPTEGSVLDWVVPSYSIANKSVFDALSDQDHQLHLQQHRLGLFYIGDNQALVTPVTVALKHTTARTCLNAVVAQSPQACWTVVTNQYQYHVLFAEFIPYDSMGKAQPQPSKP